jgi:hypothetical protein
VEAGGAAAAERVGANSGGVVVVKAQVKTGGRGKAGGVKVAKNADEAVEAAAKILGMDIKGHTVKTVMIAQGARIAQEYYFSILLDRANRTYLAMCSVEGGMDIETLAVEHPEKLARVAGRPDRRARRGQGPRDRRRGRLRRGRQGGHRRRARQTRGGVCRRRTPRSSRSTRWSRPRTAQIVALDGKVTLDNNADFRHPDHEDLVDHSATDPLEVLAIELDLNYVKLDGNIGIIGNGAGLVMSTLDVVAYAGEEFTARTAATRGRPTSWTSAVARTPTSWPTAWTSSSRTTRSRRSSSTSSAASPRATRSPTASSRPTRSSPATASAQAARRAPGRQQRREGPRDPRRTPGCPCSSASTPWTARLAASPNSRLHCRLTRTKI